jgi:hypothetical protein
MCHVTLSLALASLLCVTEPPDCQRARGQVRGDRGGSQDPRIAVDSRRAGRRPGGRVLIAEGPSPRPAGREVDRGLLFRTRFPAIRIPARMNHREHDHLAVIDAIVDPEGESRRDCSTNTL